jgi:hypothetical protein
LLKGHALPADAKLAFGKMAALEPGWAAAYKLAEMELTIHKAIVRSNLYDDFSVFEVPMEKWTRHFSPPSSFLRKIAPNREKLCLFLQNPT